MGNSESMEASQGGKYKSIPEKVHDFYYKAFPGADCPVTGAARDKLLSASRCQQQSQGVAESCGSSQQRESAADASKAQGKYRNPHVYDVYGRRIDEEAQKQGETYLWKMPAWLYYGIPPSEEINPANRMPKQANQLPAAGQKEPLSTFRQRSTIPKGGTVETWMYPSPQMFFNSLRRKGKADDVSEKDMDAVVATHNFVNESTWLRLLQWEELYAQLYPESSKEEPRLLYFQGRPFELSPKARFKKLMGYGEPFDRHDWTVDRGGRLFRYVIDFYYDESSEGTGKWPFFIDVRPALDSFPALVLRARMLATEVAGKSGLASSLELKSNSSQTDSQGRPAI